MIRSPTIKLYVRSHNFAPKPARYYLYPVVDYLKARLFPFVCILSCASFRIMIDLMRFDLLALVHGSFQRRHIPGEQPS
jgi:hypothetical protein